MDANSSAATTSQVHVFFVFIISAHEPDQPAEHQHAARQRAKQQPADLLLLRMGDGEAVFLDRPRPMPSSSTVRSSSQFAA